MSSNKEAVAAGEFSEEFKKGVYHAIYARRDIRSQFLSRPIPEKVLSRILSAAHHAPSVGFMQPWNFLLVQRREIRERIHQAFRRANADAALMFPDEKRERYRSFKQEGILESPLNLCVTCDRDRFGPVVM